MTGHAVLPGRGFGLEARPNAVLMGEPDSLCLLALQHVAAWCYLCFIYLCSQTRFKLYCAGCNTILSLDDIVKCVRTADQEHTSMCR